MLRCLEPFPEHESRSGPRQAEGKGLLTPSSISRTTPFTRMRPRDEQAGQEAQKVLR